MEMLVFGEAGAPILAFPPARGRFFDWEDHGLIAALARQIASGWNQIWCLDGMDECSFFSAYLHPRDRLQNHQRWEEHLVQEVLARVRQQNPDTYVMTAGCGFGAYHAANFAMRHPGLIRRCIAMGGELNIRNFFDGVDDALLYFHNPEEYMANMHDEMLLKLFREKLDIVLAVPRNGPSELLESNRRMAAILAGKRIPHSLDYWESPGDDWALWRAQLVTYVGRL
ncbi:MAG: esterase [Candidatus Schekmanbacteria bacterium]|nr:esterase [Candidatus Schekmanbacteria bacterium]